MSITLETTAAIRTPVTQVKSLRAPSTDWNAYLSGFGYAGFHLRSEWARIFAQSLRHVPYCLEARRHGQLVGVLPLMFIKSRLFGRFLVSQPYLNTGGIVADDADACTALLDQAVRLADELDVKHLELRHEQPVCHAKLIRPDVDKVHMRLPLPGTTAELWDGLKSKVRSQVRKPLQRDDLTCAWGRHDQLDTFYNVFSANMRDLGTPPFSKRLFAAMLDEFGGDAEICTVQLDGRSIASGFLLHGGDVTFVPSASSLREYNSTGANMLLYWHLLCRAIERGSRQFDFGRSSEGSGTHRFKKQWGSQSEPATWQYYLRDGELSDMRPDGGKYDRMIAVWKKLPIWVTRLVGPLIVRGIP